MGGVLTLIFASKYSFDDIFIISALLGIRRFVNKLVPFFKIFKKILSNKRD
jgi:esterase/lipase